MLKIYQTKNQNINMKRKEIHVLFIIKIQKDGNKYFFIVQSNEGSRKLHNDSDNLSSTRK